MKTKIETFILSTEKSKSVTETSSGTSLRNEYIIILEKTEDKREL